MNRTCSQSALPALGQRWHKKSTFYSLEKYATTIRLAKMNLAVHGFEHELLRKADFVMANPPFNMDEIDDHKVNGAPASPLWREQLK